MCVRSGSAARLREILSQCDARPTRDAMRDPMRDAAALRGGPTAHNRRRSCCAAREWYPIASTIAIASFDVLSNSLIASDVADASSSLLEKVSSHKWWTYSPPVPLQMWQG
jgi:hypothetical protein